MKTKEPDVVVVRLRELVAQAKQGNAGLIVISVSTAEQIIKRLDPQPV